METGRECKIVVYPGFGFTTRRGGAVIRVAGVVYEHRRPLGMSKEFLVKMLARAMSATPEELLDETFRSRLAPFVAKTRRGLRVWLQIGPRRFRLRRRTRRSGWFRGKLRLSSELLNRLRKSGALRGSQLTFRVWLSADTQVKSTGTAFLLPPLGISVVSDIDDTIKLSEVSNRRELLANTFLREFRGIEGMAELYREWAGQGAAFHYVSSSPWQLFDPILQWAAEAGFPAGTLHLRTFRLRDQVIRRRANAKRRKRQSISKMMKGFPRRRFILVGDSGERDPELYARLCSKYADRIAAVFIRDLESQPLGKRRFEQMKLQAAPVLCARFATAGELKQLAAPFFH